MTRNASFAVFLKVILFVSIFLFQTLVFVEPSESALAKPSMVAPGTSFTCVLLTDRTVECWGSNTNGQLGNGTTTDSLDPVKVSGLVDAVSIAAGADHACALLLSGELKCWGANDFGQLGDGSGVDQSTPVSVFNARGTMFGSVSLSLKFSCAVDQDRYVWCWGDNRYGQLGVALPFGESKSLTPFEVMGNGGKPKTSALNTCSGSSSILYCWGQQYSKLGVRSIPSCLQTPNICESIPTRVWVDEPVYGLGSGSSGRGICALLSGGRVSCWTIGTGTPRIVDGLSGVVALSQGYGGHVCAILANQSVSCWGLNSSGQVGDGTYQDRSTPFNHSSLGKVTSISSGHSNTCAIFENSSVKCWGANQGGQLGYSTILPNAPSPADVTAYAAASFDKTGFPAISGSSVVGGVLSVDTGTWDSGVSFSYQWLRNGQPIAQANGPTYILQAEDLYSQVGVQVTGSKFGYQPVMQSSSSISVAVGTLTKIGNASINGSPVVGGVLIVNPDSWDSGVTFSYQWLRNGQPILSGNLRYYLIQASDSGSFITVKTIASKPGYENHEVISEVQVALRVYGKTGLPVVSGSPVVGGVLNASTGVWDAGVGFSYQWLRNGQPIANANGATYMLKAADVNSNVNVSVTGSKSGYQPATESSSAVSIASGTLTRIGSVSIFGSPVVGGVLNASTGVWDAGVGFSYQWLRNGQPIFGATLKHLKLSPLDWGQTIQVQVLAHKPGFGDKLTTSQQVVVENLEWRVSLDGDLQVGQQIWVNASVRSNIYTHTYQWFVGSLEKLGQNSRSYVPIPEDVGLGISVRACINYSGFQILCKIVQSGETIPKMTFKRSFVVISGSTRSGKTLEGQVMGVPAGTAYSYQWHRDGVAISGANSKFYIVRNEDKNSKIAVQVTISKEGFESVSIEAKPKLIG
jgi:hypothetical protein